MRQFLLVISLLAAPVIVGAQKKSGTGGKAETKPIPENTPPPFVLQEQALRQLKDIEVRINIQNTGIDTTSTRNHVELRLRQTGLVVSATATGELLIVCGVVAEKLPIRGYACKTTYLDFVYRFVPRSEKYYATLWEGRMFVGTVGSNTLESAVSELIDLEIEEFLNAWLKMNPR